MRKFGFFLITIYLFSSSGCSELATNPLDSSTPTTVQTNPTNTIEISTSLPPSKLQITFIDYKSDFTEFYAVDITCAENDNLCFDDPKLLFKTLPASNSEPNKPTGLIDGYNWSPDGDKIVLSANKDLFIGDMNTEEWENITNSPDVEEYHPKWSQDKRYIYIIFHAHRTLQVWVPVNWLGLILSKIQIHFCSPQ